MPAIKITCKYELCTRGKDGGRKTWYGTKSAMYCCGKHGTYQRRLNERRKRTNEVVNGERHRGRKGDY